MIGFSHKYGYFFLAQIWLLFLAQVFFHFLAQVWFLSWTNVLAFSHLYDTFRGQIWWFLGQIWWFSWTNIMLSRINMILFLGKFDGFLGQIWCFWRTNMKIWLPTRPLIFDADSTQKLSVLKNCSHFPKTNSRRVFFLQFLGTKFEFLLLRADLYFTHQLPFVPHKGIVKRALIVKHIPQMEPVEYLLPIFFSKQSLLSIFLVKWFYFQYFL